MSGLGDGSLEQGRGPGGVGAEVNRTAVLPDNCWSLRASQEGGSQRLVLGEGGAARLCPRLGVAR